MPRDRARLALLTAASLAATVLALAAAPPDASKPAASKTQESAARKKRGVPAGPAPEALNVAALKPPAGFRVELVHRVDRETQGSWVSMTVDTKGRLYVSDQYGKLYRVSPSKPGTPAEGTKVEAVPVPIGGAHGLLWAFDSLYVMNNEAQGGRRGLYRLRDTNGDDVLDSVELLRALEGGGEHGPHAVVLGPDGRSLYVVAGNATRLPELAGSKVPRIWGEDNLNPHMPDGAGFMANEKAPGGWVCKVDPEGKSWELVSMGYRNPYDLAFNRDGELFTYDSDMEWDMNLPWYRPTRVCHVVSGSDFGYRNGSGKWPTYYLDSLPPVVDIGPGSPTGLSFGYGTNFPARYRDALFMCDWSYGRLYAVHLKSKGASYGADVEEFMQGSPLPLTDLVVNPSDQAMYFTVGGRRTASGLYRIVYAGGESAGPGVEDPKADMDARAVRHRLEALHGVKDPAAIETLWKYLGHPDRFIAYAARTALESQDPLRWGEKARSREFDPDTTLPALLALIRVSAPDPAHRKPDAPAPDPELKRQIMFRLWSAGRHSYSPDARLLRLARVYEVFLVRFGGLNVQDRESTLRQLADVFPSKSREVNSELAQIWVALEAPDAAGKIVELLCAAPTQEEQIDYARDLRVLKTGWTPAQRMAYFAWFLRAARFHGGNSLRGFLRQIREESLANLGEADRAVLRPLLDAQSSNGTGRPAATTATPARPFVKNWTLDELVPLVETGLKGRNFDRGRLLFADAACASCHRYSTEGGGAGPDLTGLAGRFTVRDLLESIVVPSKVISDQYGAVTIATSDGVVVTGRVVNLSGDSLSVCTNMLDPNNQVHVDRHKIEEMKPSPVSMMPEGLLNTLKSDEILDLVAFLLSRGDPKAPAFSKP